jgi:hypothetical protein
MVLIFESSGPFSRINWGSIFTLSLDLGVVLKKEEIVRTDSDVRGMGDVNDGSFRPAVVFTVILVFLGGTGGESLSCDGRLGSGLGFGELGFCGRLFSKKARPVLADVAEGLAGFIFAIIGDAGDEDTRSRGLRPRFWEIAGDFADFGGGVGLSLGEVGELVAFDGAGMGLGNGVYGSTYRFEGKNSRVSSSAGFGGSSAGELEADRLDEVFFRLRDLAATTGFGDEGLKGFWSVTDACPLVRFSVALRGEE